MLNKAHQREINDLEVCCTYKDVGCTWKGKVKDLETHTGGGEGSCGYVEVFCKWKCGEKILKRDIVHHERQKCAKRPWYLEFDDARVQSLGERVHKLEEANLSLKKEVKSVRTELRIVKDENTKLLVEVEQLSTQQCETGQRQEEFETKVNLILTEVEKLKQNEFVIKTASVLNEIQKLREDNLQLRGEVANLTQKQQSGHKSDHHDPTQERHGDGDIVSSVEDDPPSQTSCTSDSPIYSDLAGEPTQSTNSSVAPFSFTMKSFKHRKEHKIIWFSPSFYSHSCGYRMQLRVDPSGTQDGEGTHISVYVYLMKGDFDDELLWPFQGHVTVRLLNQIDDTNHYERVIDFPKGTNPLSVNRVTVGGRVKAGHGYSQFIPYIDLSCDERCQYLKDNCLKFVVFVTAHSSSPQVKPSIPIFGRIFK